MRILVDAYWWYSGPPSGKNVLRSIVMEWLSSYPQDLIFLQLKYKDRSRAETIALQSKFPNLRIVYTRAPQHALAAIFSGIGRNRYDKVFTQNFTPLFASGIRSVFIHDLMFKDHPEWFGARERLYLRWIPIFAKSADVIFTSSKSEAKRIGNHLIHCRAKIIPVGLGLSKEYENAISIDPKISYPGQRFFLSVGRINARKNIRTLVEALLSGKLISGDLPLVIVGKPDGAQESYASIMAAEKEGSVIWAGHVSDGQLKWLYQNCDLFIFPSLDEGYGLPILEAAHEGCRLVISDIPAFAEFNLKSQSFDPKSRVSIANAVKRAIEHSDLNERVGVDLPQWREVLNGIRSSLESVGD